MHLFSMRALRLLFALFLLASVLLVPRCVFGREIILTWEASPETEEVIEYRIYIVHEDGKLEQLKSVPATFATVQIPDTKTRLAITAFNGLESKPTNLLTIPVRPTPPTGFRARMEIDRESVQKEADSEELEIESDVEDELYQ